MPETSYPRKVGAEAFLINSPSVCGQGCSQESNLGQRRGLLLPEQPQQRNAPLAGGAWLLTTAALMPRFVCPPLSQRHSVTSKFLPSPAKPCDLRQGLSISLKIKLGFLNSIFVPDGPFTSPPPLGPSAGGCVTHVPGTRHMLTSTSVSRPFPMLVLQRRKQRHRQFKVLAPGHSKEVAERTCHCLLN